MDFGPYPGVRVAERKGRKRENQAQNRPGSAEGEVRKFPHKPARTRGNTRDRPRKNPNSDELGFLYWWWVVHQSGTFYSHSIMLAGARACMRGRDQAPTDRQILHRRLQETQLQIRAGTLNPRPQSAVGTVVPIIYSDQFPVWGMPEKGCRQAWAHAKITPPFGLKQTPKISRQALSTATDADRFVLQQCKQLWTRNLAGPPDQ